MQLRILKLPPELKGQGGKKGGEYSFIKSAVISHNYDFKPQLWSKLHITDE